MFADRSRIFIKAGNGGKGCDSLYHVRPMRYPRRDGGDGGDGGNVIIKADPNVHTLLDFRYRQHFKAESGKHGSSNQKRGRCGNDYLILVPLGTIIRDAENNYLIRDLNIVGDQVVVAVGGKGGIGNAKKIDVTEGAPGQELTVLLELKLIADVGLIGYPNAGKSSLVNVLSGAKSKVADFPFSTVRPVLGVVKSTLSENRFTVADIPGIIKDAHKGKGLGLEFLRHIERTKILLFLIDMAGIDGRDPVQDYVNLRNEIECYDRTLLQKPHFIVANKMDVPAAKDNLKLFKQVLKQRIFLISCLDSSGIAMLTQSLFKKIFVK
ncbi:MAG: Obg family GTPase CgtA [Candidatus Omnitrophota bacterium]